MRPMSETSAQEPAHDVLAAEAFAVPAQDKSLHHDPVVLPDDPTGIAEPHDVLAAEEFPMPAGTAPAALVAPEHRRRVGAGALAAAVLGFVALGRRRGRRR
jgi:hypothetical protein